MQRLSLLACLGVWLCIADAANAQMIALTAYGDVIENVALGHGSLGSVVDTGCGTCGYGNTAEGFSSLALNTTGVDNTASGYEALGANTTGNYNTSLGMTSLEVNRTGSNNTATGALALQTNT